MTRFIALSLAAGGTTEAEATGNPAAFETDVAKPLKSLLVPFYPVQAGSGDASPENERSISGWTGVNANRTGKNMLPPSVFYYYQSTYLDVSGDTITVKKSDDRAWSALNGLFLKAGKYVITRSNAQGNLTIRTSINDYASNLLQTQNASASFTLSADCTIKIKFGGSSVTYPYDTTVMIEPGETASTYEPYSGNTYPVVFPSMGKNLFDKDGTIYHRYFNMGDTVEWKYSADSKSVAIPVKGNTQYTLSGYGDSATIYRIGFLNQDLPTGNESVPLSNAVSTGNYSSFGASRTFTTDTETRYVVVQFNASAFTDTVAYMQLEEGSSATAFEPYTNTVYGGEIDLATGVMTVEWIGASATWGSIKTGTASAVSGNMNGYLNVDKPLIVAGSGANASKCFCNVAKYAWENKDYVAAHFYPSTYNNGASYRFTVYLHKDTDDDTVVSCVGMLTTPFTIQLDPVTIQTLIGNNTVWTDTNGENTVVYLKRR